MPRSLARLLLLALVSVLPAAPAGALAQADELSPDLEAAKAFEELVTSLRERDALRVKTALTIEIEQGGASKDGPRVEAEFTYARGEDGAAGGSGVVKLREFTCFIHKGQFAAIHGTTDEHSYFTSSIDGAPYWMFFNLFNDAPFPHIAMLWGDQPMEEVWMELYANTPELVPIAVREETLGERTVKTIEFKSADAGLSIHIDPDSNLVVSMDHEITGGDFVQDGVVMRTRYECEHLPTDDVIEQTFVFDPGARQRVDMLATLVDRPPGAPAAPGMPGVPDMAGGGALVGTPAPPLVLATAEGGAIDLQELQGRVVVLDFWATWCPPCRVGLPILHEAARWADAEQLPVTIITVNTFEGNTLREGDTPEARLASVRDFWASQKFTLPVAMDFSDETARAYGVSAIPSTIIIRSDGVVHQQHTGVVELEQLKAEITEAIAALNGPDEAP